jgi:hypothetical protein
MQLFRGQPVAIALLSTLLVLSTAYAQNQKSDTAATTAKTDAAQTSQKTTAPTKENTSQQSSNTGNSNTPTPTPTSGATSVITGASTGTNDVKVAQSTITDASAATDNAAAPTDLPQIPGGYTIPVAQVPPTLNAPYMQVSKLPAGTVFIVVGAILGFLALAVVLWRGLTVWALKRSVKRAAKGNNVQDTKALLNFRPPAAPVYNRYSDRDSTLSLANLRKSPKPTRPTTSSGAAPGQSLFFSPTAGGSMLNPGNRNSGYLPSGYYAAGASAPGNGSGMADSLLARQSRCRIWGLRRRGTHARRVWALRRRIVHV